MKVWSGPICLGTRSGTGFRKYGRSVAGFHKWRWTLGPTERLLDFLHFPFCELQLNCYRVTNKSTHLLRMTITFWYAKCYTCRASVAHHQAVHSCTYTTIVQPLCHSQYVELWQGVTVSALRWACALEMVAILNYRDYNQFHVLTNFMFCTNFMFWPISCFVPISCFDQVHVLYQFHVLFTCKITTATGWQPNCSK